ncbi:MAG TPA: PIG-L family deacetylase [Vicinamibacterales bacterium]|nr:PIG-L family deacetylase [Vicinamibacterales bacterium]
MRASSLAFGAVLAVSLLCDDATAAKRAQPRTPAPTIVVTADTRLLVVAPHPDDETLGAGGLMQRVREAGGRVHVVYLTDGDGYPEGVQFEGHVESPTANDYRGYGRRRRAEARAALNALKLGRYSYTFLGFPDGGLCRLTRQYWSEHRGAYRSPYTRLDRPPKGEVVVPNSEYRGEDLTQELARIIGDYQPTIVLVPRREDQHADHCAAWYFVADALHDVKRVHPDFTTDLLNYIIHWNSWPFEDEEDRHLPTPPGLRGGASGWIEFRLTPAEQRAKRDALRRYVTQEHVMSWFLDGFARANEVFSRPRPPQTVLPARRNLCCDQ